MRSPRVSSLRCLLVTCCIIKLKHHIEENFKLALRSLNRFVMSSSMTPYLGAFYCRMATLSLEFTEPSTAQAKSLWGEKEFLYLAFYKEEISCTQAQRNRVIPIQQRLTIRQLCCGFSLQLRLWLLIMRWDWERPFNPSSPESQIKTRLKSLL